MRQDGDHAHHPTDRFGPARLDQSSAPADQQPAPDALQHPERDQLPMVQASPHSIEPARKTAIAAIHTRLAPKRSAAHPVSGIATASASRYAVLTHWIVVTVVWGGAHHRRGRVAGRIAVHRRRRVPRARPGHEEQVSDPSPTATGRLVNGAFSLPAPLQTRASSAGGTGGVLAPVGGSASPTTVLNYANPVANDAVTLAFRQAICGE